MSPVALHNRATSAVQQSIEIVRRRIDETGVVDPLITRQGDSRIIVQLPGVEDPNRIKELLGQTARMTFRLTDENANLAATVPPPGVDFLSLEGKPGQKIAVRRRIDDAYLQARSVLAEPRYQLAQRLLRVAEYGPAVTG